MPACPSQGGNNNTWGTDLRAFLTVILDLTTGLIKSDGSVSIDNVPIGVTTPARGRFIGTSTNDSAGSGEVGEIITATNSGGTSLTSATPANISSISLTAGDWDVWGSINGAFSGGSGTISLNSAINTASATLPSTNGTDNLTYSGVVNYSTNIILPVRTRISIASTTTVYLVTQTNFGSGSCTGYGKISARRAR